MEIIKYPLILNDKVFHEVRVFMTADDANNSLERDGDYSVYDAEGRLASLRMDTDGYVIDGFEEQPNHKDELKQILIDFLTRYGKTVEDMKEWTLDQLFREASKQPKHRRGIW
jgi:hypothetical protein